MLASRTGLRRSGIARLAGLLLLSSALVPAFATGSADATGTGRYSAAASHSYRHGVLPTVDVLRKLRNSSSAQPEVASAIDPRTLSYGGGSGGSGVISGHNKTYLIFWGSQWGTSSTDANGNLKFSGDSAGAAGAAQRFFKGIGTNNEQWSADLLEWCDGSGVAHGATSCPAGATHIPYQTGGVLTGVWYDNSTTAPAAATASQIGNEAVRAATHFGNSGAANRYSDYVIMSPHGTDPDNYLENGFCAWHDYSGSPGSGAIAYSNQPYNIDAGAACGVGFVNSPGTLDGYTITLGHEWQEIMTDPWPSYGWTNQQFSSSYYGDENADECAWIAPGQPGGATDVSFGSYGTFAEQLFWSNAQDRCVS